MMHMLAPTEITMWEKPVSPDAVRPLDEEINAKYAKRELRIVTESNREQLPNFVEALRRKDWMDLRPFYQRRPRWDPIRQSKLIESFIMNIPVPPLFVYEADLAKYEVMDGQQRILTISDFYGNKLKLQGLEQWPELNGRIYDTLPSEIRKGIDRRSISYIVLLKESASTTEEEALLRQEVFERLNTGGVKLSHQEIRNALYHGKLNSLLLDLVKNNTFRRIWGFPDYSEEAEQNRSPDLVLNSLWVQMRDAEIVLRFFALRHVKHYRRGMRGFLDLYMVRARSFTNEDIEILRTLFERTIAVGWEIYDDLFAKPWDPTKKEWTGRRWLAFADAIMVGISRHLDRSTQLQEQREAVIEDTKRLFEESPVGTFSGRGNTKADVQERIRLYDEMLQRHLD
jgi:hypothetical protein